MFSRISLFFDFLTQFRLTNTFFGLEYEKFEKTREHRENTKNKQRYIRQKRMEKWTTFGFPPQCPPPLAILVAFFLFSIFHVFPVFLHSFQEVFFWAVGALIEIIPQKYGKQWKSRNVKNNSNQIIKGKGTLGGNPIVFNLSLRICRIYRCFGFDVLPISPFCPDFSRPSQLMNTFFRKKYEKIEKIENDLKDSRHTRGRTDKHTGGIPPTHPSHPCAYKWSERRFPCAPEHQE